MKRISFQLATIQDPKLVDKTTLQQALPKIKADGWLAPFKQEPEAMLVTNASKNARHTICYEGPTSGQYAYQIRLFYVNPNGSYQPFCMWGVPATDSAQGAAALIAQLQKSFQSASSATQVDPQFDIPISNKSARVAALVRLYMAATVEDLVSRLEKVQGLVDRGATQGERAAAEAQKATILNRLKSEFGWAPKAPKSVDLPSFIKKK